MTEPAALFLVLFAVILFAPILAERARVPGIIGLLLAGVAIGPGALGLIERQGAVAALGSAGLLYLLFLGGLDMDVEGYLERRRASLLYGMATFAVPMAINTGVALGVGFDWLAALLIASAFTSHTPVSYPLVQRFGLARTGVVTVTLGATVLAVVGALLVLAVLVGVADGDIGPLFWARLLASLAAYAAVMLWGLPRLTRWFFTGLGQDRTVRVLFVLVVLFASAVLAGLAGIEPIVGAFLAGLALNRFIGQGTQVMQRLQLLGSLLFIPAFLISTGMLIDPAALVSSPRTLAAGVALTVSALAAKWLAAWPVARALGYDRAEAGVMFSLSAGQAAGALATVIVGVEVGIVTEEAVNITVLVMLVTCLVAPWVAGRVVPRVRPPEPRASRIGDTVVVPIANPESLRPLVRLASLIARGDAGSVAACAVVGEDAGQEVIAERRRIIDEAERLALASGAEASSLVRIDASPTAGVVHTAVESGASCLLMGWKGFSTTREHFFGGVIDGVLSRSPVPVLVCRTTDRQETPGKVVLTVSPADLAPAGLPGLELGVRVSERLAGQAKIPLVVVTEDPDEDGEVARMLSTSPEVVHDPRKPALALRQHTDAGDIVVAATPPARPGLGQNAVRLARALPDRTLITVLPRSGATTIPGRGL